MRSEHICLLDLLGVRIGANFVFSGLGEAHSKNSLSPQKFDSIYYHSYTFKQNESNEQYIFYRQKYNQGDLDDLN